MSRSVNIVIIIGNLTRDPELRYTPGGHAVSSFGVATNRSWVSDGEQKEETEFHNVVAWNKLAELCSQLLSKGRRVYIQGRLQTRTWEGNDGVRRSRTEIVADEMVVLDYRPRGEVAETAVEIEKSGEQSVTPSVAGPAIGEDTQGEAASTGEEKIKEEEVITERDIPF